MKYQLTQIGDIFTIIKDGQPLYSSKDGDQCNHMYDRMVEAAKENKAKLGILKEIEI